MLTVPSITHYVVLEYCILIHFVIPAMILNVSSVEGIWDILHEVFTCSATVPSFEPPVVCM
jgi:hypothetical protein